MDSSSGCGVSGAKLSRSRDSRLEAMSAELAGTGASPDLLADLATGWYLGSVAMVAFAVIVLAVLVGSMREETCGPYRCGHHSPHLFNFRITCLLVSVIQQAFPHSICDPGSPLGRGRLQVQMGCAKVVRSIALFSNSIILGLPS
jgi:hypothetical protein